LIGSRLGPYEITAKLGEGGMGEVYRATDTKLDREVAIKVLPAAFVEDHERLARFEREAKLLAQLHHPNIASIFGLEESGGVRALVMELVEGPTLADRLAQGGLAIDESLSIARQIAEALEEAHERGIVHRDLKPQNVKASREGKVKVLDFGLAKAMEPSGTASSSAADRARSPTWMHSPTLTAAGTQLGMILGTAAYMAPEQAKGLAVDKRADIWAFGVVLWEMLTGRQMFVGETVQETLGLVMLREPDLAALPAATPRRLRELLARCLERDPKRRLRDIGEARLALERIAAGDRGEPEPAPGPRAGIRWLPIAAAGALCALLAFAAARYLAPAASSAPLRRLDLVAEGVSADWYLGPTLSPDGSKIAYSGENGVWVRDLGELAARQVATIEQPSPLFWSPDSAALGYASGRKLWRVSADGRQNLALCDLPGTGWAISGAWREDGTIAFSTWRGAVYRVPAEGGRPVQMFAHDPEREIDFHYLSWLPDGRLLFAAHRNLVSQATGADVPALSASPLEPLEIATFDGTERRAIDWRDSGDLEWLAYDARTRLLLYARTTPSVGVWARPVDPESLSPVGEEFLLLPEARTLSLAQDGSLIYMETTRVDGVNELVWVDRAGRILSILAPGQEGLKRPSLSPDGRRIAITAKGDTQTEVWIVDVARGISSRLTFDASEAVTPVWADGSRRIVYTELDDMASTIVMRAADGSGGRRELFHGGAVSESITLFSPDGRELLFGVDDRGATRLRLAPIGDDGTLGEPRTFFATQPEPNVREARISPDGRLLAYVTADSGQPEVFLTRFPSGEGRWQVSPDSGSAARWAAATGELFFVAGGGPGVRALAVAEVEDRGEVVVGKPSMLFRIGGDDNLQGGDGGFDVVADGSRFVMVRVSSTGRSATRRMILIQNWRGALPERERR